VRPQTAVEKPFGFPKKERIFQSQDFRSVMKYGKRLSTKNIVVFVRSNEKGFHRLGIVVKKEVGTAPFRNRMKRYFREAFRLHKRKIAGQSDLVVLVKKGCSIKRYDDAEADLKRLLLVQ